ncbi:hypothetical protein [Flavobacterium sp. FlaQc-28]|uniref:hypothetical protein n=1 Tax=Flavobacterium sp. FlaQc-28 TaxID=3374178 RepID=UPI0037565A3B
MKFIIAFVFLTQQFVFSQEKNINFFPLNREFVHVSINSITFKVNVLGSKYKNRYDLARDTILKSGNYIITDGDFFSKFSVNKVGKVDGKLDQKFMENGKIYTIKHIVSNGFISKSTLYDSTDNMINDSDIYYCEDTIEIITISANGDKTITIETPDKTEIRKYDRNGTFLDEEIWNKAGIGGPGK